MSITTPTYTPRFPNHRPSPSSVNLQNSRKDDGQPLRSNAEGWTSSSRSTASSEASNVEDSMEPTTLPHEIKATIGGDSVGDFRAKTQNNSIINRNSDYTFTLSTNKDGSASVIVNNVNRQNDFKVVIDLEPFMQLPSGEKLPASSILSVPVGPSQYGGENYAPVVTVTKKNNGQLHIEADFSHKQIDNILNMLHSLNITGAPLPSKDHIEEAIELIRKGEGDKFNLVETMFDRLNSAHSTKKLLTLNDLQSHANSFIEGVNNSLTIPAFTHDGDASSSAIQKSIEKGTVILQNQATRVKSSAEHLIDSLSMASKLDIPIKEILTQLNDGFRSIDNNIPPLKISDNAGDAEVNVAIEQVHSLIQQKQEAFFKDANQKIGTAYAQLSGQISSEDTDKLLNGLNTAFNVVSGISGLADLAKGMISSVRSLNKARSSLQKLDLKKNLATFELERSQQKFNKNAQRVDRLDRRLAENDKSFDPVVLSSSRRISDRLDSLRKEQKSLRTKVQDKSKALASASKEVADKQLSLQNEKKLQYFDRVTTPFSSTTSNSSSIVTMLTRYKSVLEDKVEAEKGVPSVPQLAANQAGPEEAGFYKTIGDNAYDLVSQQVDEHQIYEGKVYTEYYGGGEATYKIYAGATPSRMFNTKVQELAEQARKLNADQKAEDQESNMRFVVVSNRVGRTLNDPYNVTFIMKVDKSKLPPSDENGEPRLFIGNNTTVLKEVDPSNLDNSGWGKIKNSWQSTYYPTGVTEEYVGNGLNWHSKPPMGKIEPSQSKFVVEVNGKPVSHPHQVRDEIEPSQSKFIVEVNGKPISHPHQLRDEIEPSQSKFVVMVNGKPITHAGQL